jgi:MFS family permease
MSATSSTPARAMRAEQASSRAAVIGPLVPIMSAVLVGFLIIGIAMPVLPLHVHQELGLGTVVVGIVAGVQFAAALLSRFWSGRYADARGGKRAMATGLVMAAVSGVLYLLSLRFLGAPVVSVVILVAGRALLGWAESCIITGALTLGLGLGGPQNAGKVIAWVGTALWAAYAAGAPAGTALYAAYGFGAIAYATVLLPLLTLLLVARVQPIAPVRQESPSYRRIVGAVSVPGFGVALSSVGFGAITTFAALLFAERGWGSAWVAFTALSVAFILGRVLFGHLPDRIGGARVALVCVLVEAAGLALIWIAPTAELVFGGAAVTGAGYSLAYPGFGVDAVRRAPAEARGLAMGAFTAFLDLALGIANPVLGVVAGWANLRAVFLISAALVACSALVAAHLLRKPDLLT